MTATQDLAQNDDLASLELLLAHFDRPTTRPADIPRLNELILQLEVVFADIVELIERTQ